MVVQSTEVPRVRVPRVEREAQILEAAESVFSARGFQAATMDEIGDLVGVTKPLIYEYFGSKEGLFAACIERARGRLASVLVSAWDDGHSGPVRDRFREVVLAFFTFIDEHEQAFALLRTEGSVIGAEAATSVERVRQQTARAFADGMRTLPQFRDVPQNRLTGLAEILIGGCERLSVWRAERHHMSADEASDLIMVALWDGLSTFPEPA